MSHAKTRTRRWVEIGAAAAVLVGILLWSEGIFRRKVGPGGEEGVSATGVAGQVAEVALADLPVVLEAVGTVRGIEEAVLSARVTGVIDRIAVRAGDRVRKGEVLAVFTAPELAAQQAAAEGAVRAAEAAVAQAESDWKRADYLFQREAATRVEWERARTALEQARGGLVQTRGAAGAAASLAAYSELRAPFDGLVTERHRDPGDLASPGVPILRVVDDRLFRLEAAIDEREAEHARPGERVEVRLDSLGVTIGATLVEVVPASDPASRTALVKAELPRLDGVRSGLFGRLRLPTGTRQAPVVPAAAIRQTGGLATVRVVRADGGVETRYVRTGAAAPDGRVEVLSGLEPGERVALAP